jgi:hypothetical protein
MKRLLKRLLGISALAAVGYAIWRAYERNRVDTGVVWEPQPFPFPPEPRAEPPAESPAEPTSTPASSEQGDRVHWVEPDDGTCPATHPVKVKLASGIFHVPGGMNYARTNADRCYADAAAAEADGYRPAKR